MPPVRWFTVATTTLMVPIIVGVTVMVGAADPIGVLIRIGEGTMDGMIVTIMATDTDARPALPPMLQAP